MASRRPLSLGVFALLVLSLPACSDDDVTGLSSAEIAGSFEATTLTATDDEGTTADALAEGASLDLTLDPDGTTSGTFVVPASLSDTGAGEQFDLTGTWRLEGDVVRFDQSADTFVRDMDFRVVSDRLEGEETFGDETVRVVLERI